MASPSGFLCPIITIFLGVSKNDCNSINCFKIIRSEDTILLKIYVLLPRFIKHNTKIKWQQTEHSQ